MSLGRKIDPFEALANAVVVQASNDFRKAVKLLSKGKKNNAAEDLKKECEEFFRSKRFSAFTSLDGEVLLSMLEKEANE